ncbi:MAG TPA: phage holin family protein [Flavobacteriales bacterium]|nr:phage holin family protein [Flavobacteriales bacterium]
MQNWFVRVLVSSLAVLITAYMLPHVFVANVATAIMIAILLSFLNTFLKPILIILTLPVTILSMGLFLLVINAAIILLADYLLDEFKVDGFIWALVFSLILSLVNSFLEQLLGTNKQQEDDRD